MEDTLKKLTDQIYNEGITKANEEAEIIISNAKKEAERIIEAAKKESAERIAKAQSDSDELKKKVNTELELTANQAVSSIKQSVANVLLENVIDKSMKGLFNDKEFLKEMILTMVKNWDSTKEQADFNILFPEDSKLDGFLQSELGKTLNNHVTFKPSKSVENGFAIETKGESYKINFTEQDFSSFIKDYIRPRTFELLFKK
ncbi:MAG: hypothetical protein IJM12_07370 [Bacteroidales bacterium]|nr:hypothetical protein [Bacteroidales bacterium]